MFDMFSVLGRSKTDAEADAVVLIGKVKMTVVSLEFSEDPQVVSSVL